MPESVSHSSQQEPLSPEKGVKIDGFLWMKKKMRIGINKVKVRKDGEGSLGN